MEEPIAFIGVDVKGYALASNIRKKMSPRATLYINDVNFAACTSFAKESGQHGPIQVVDSAKEAGIHAKVVISIVPGAAEVPQVFLNPDRGVVAAPKDSERLLLDCSTIDCQTSMDVGEKLKEAGSGAIRDALVSAGLPGAQAGTLSFLIGHSTTSDSDPVLRRIEAIVSTTGSPGKFFWCDSPGSGLAVKIADNYIACRTLFRTLMTITEAIAIGVRQGVDPKLLCNCIKNPTGQSWMCDNVLPKHTFQKQLENSWFRSAQIRTPTLILAPAKSAATKVEEQKAIQQQIRGSRLVVVEGAGHEIYVDKAERGIEELLHFIQSRLVDFFLVGAKCMFKAGKSWVLKISELSHSSTLWHSLFIAKS